MTSEPLSTHFAPAERSSPAELAAQSAAVASCFFSNPILKQMFDTLPNAVVVVNRYRQLVFVNKALRDTLGSGSVEVLYGSRPGEALDCVHARESEGGCGTTEFCSTCGMVLAVLSSLCGRDDVKECRILKREQGDAYDFRVKTTPFELEGEPYVIVALEDISDDKRRRALERIFFHDILNTAGAVWSLSSLLPGTSEEKTKALAGHIYSVSGRLIDEIKAQRELLSAENRELQLTIAPIGSLLFLEELSMAARALEAEAGREVVIAGDSAELEFESDPVQLGRVIYNMLKNALEASKGGEKVTLGCRADEGMIEFYVHNPSCMPRTVQLQVFQRSYSTKGANRGIGAYSMKLLTERYLGGTIGFRSTPEEGTTFYGRYPLKFPTPVQS